MAARGRWKLLGWGFPGVATMIVASCSSVSHGMVSGAATGRVLSAPSDCIRASSDGGFSNFGYMCFSGSPGKPGDCVRVGFSNGGKMVSGITRLPLFSSASQPESACSTAMTSTFGEADGPVSSRDPRCMSVALPYPGTRAGQLCGSVTLGTPGQCVSVLYSIGGAGASPDVKSHAVISSSSCSGLRPAT